MSDTTIRVIVFEEGDRFVAQCLEYDICVFAPSIPSLLDRLDVTIEAEFATCEAAGKSPREAIGAAPSSLVTLWPSRAVQLKRIDASTTDIGSQSGFDLDIGMIETSRAAA